MDELCRFAFSKPTTCRGAFSKPEKANDGKSMHELCRFAGLFSLDPTKNTQYFHWVEQCNQEMSMRQSKRQTHRKANSNEPLQPLLSIADVCRMFGLSRPKIHDLIVHEGLPTIKFGRAVRISPTSLQRWLAGREEIA